MRGVLRYDHISHLGIVALPDWHLIPCESLGKLLEEGRNLVCHGFTFAPPYCAAWILGKVEDQDLNIAATSQGLLPLLTGQATPCEEALDWLQCACTPYRTGDYLAPASTALVQTVVV